MKMPLHGRWRSSLLAPARSAPAARRCRPRPAFKDGNKDYKEENFKKAIENYERAVELDPTIAEA